MGILKEFKEFAMRGSVVDLAIAVVIGGAFGKIVTSFVDDVLMPPIGYFSGGVDFSELKYILQEGVATANEEGVVEMVGEVAVSYGLFFNTVINFLIVAFAIFMVVKLINKVKKNEEEVPAEPTVEESLLTEIRDLLKKN